MESAMETLKGLMLDTLKELENNEFMTFKWYLQQPGNVEGLQPLSKWRLEHAEPTRTVDLIIQYYTSNGAQVMVNVLKKIRRNDLLVRFLDKPNVHEKSITVTLEERIMETLGELKTIDLEKFQRNPALKAIPEEKLRRANRPDTVDLIMYYYPDAAEYVIMSVLQQIHKDDADTLARLLDILKGSNEKKRKINREDLRDDPDASTSTLPRTWLPVSKRWRQQLEKLVNMDDSKVKKVKSLVLGKGTEFRIAQGSDGVEVFLGLRYDGTEVAVKRMSRTCDLYGDLKNDELYLRLPELDDPLIVRYVDFVEDEDYGYLALQLCEYTLEEYITKLPEQRRKQLAKQVLNSLRILHCQYRIIHRDIKPQNVLIDIQGKGRLADFGISRRIDKGKTTYHSTEAGTSCWMTKETLNPGFHSYRKSTDIQVAGMLIHYILSGGHHPFLEDTTNGTILECQNNICEGNYYLKHVDHDVVAKDLVEWMIHRYPVERPTVEQCLGHPFFWPNTWREEYLTKIGNEREVEMYRKAEEDENEAKDEEEKKLIRSLKVLITALEQYAEQGQFNAWKQKFREAKEETRQLFEVMDEHYMKRGPDAKKKKFYSDNSFGLLRFIRNLHAHYAEKVAGIDLMEMFPDLFGYVYKFAKEQDWNSRPALRKMFDFCPRCAVLNTVEDTVSASVLHPQVAGPSQPNVSMMASEKLHEVDRSKMNITSFTPTVHKVQTTNEYRFKFPRIGLFQCSVTGLVFVTTREGEVLYRAVEWDEKCLQALEAAGATAGAPAGPLFDIKCPEQSVYQLRLLHCEATLDDDLSVVHITDAGVEFLKPLEVTKTHVVVNVPHLCRFGLWISNALKARPTIGKVRLFFRTLDKILEIYEDARNVPRGEVGPNNEEVTEVPGPADDRVLIPNQNYRLLWNGVQQASQPYRRHFGPNHYPTWEVPVDLNRAVNSLKVRRPDGTQVWAFNLSAEELHQASSRMVVADTGNIARAALLRLAVVPGAGNVAGAGASTTQQTPKTQEVKAAEELLLVRLVFIQRVSEDDLLSLLDKLLDKKVITYDEMKAVQGENLLTIKARKVIDMVYEKVDEACSIMIDILHQLDSIKPHL